jgi:23S rRNA (cytosine1962-C5)-methyltransferase
MHLLVAESWKEYELIDSGNGRRLERFGDYTLNRPDPQAIWNKTNPNDWQRADFTFKTSWQGNDIQQKWKVSYKDLSFFARLTPFKHTGIFPEQSVNWDWMREKIKNSSQGVKVLNLFGYTGIATLACAAEGAFVTHVDASRPSIGWARENQEISGLSDKQIRWILDDAVKFCERESRRGNTYEGIIMDPPVYGHGPDGERWDFLENFSELLDVCSSLLSEKALFFLVNAYAISATSVMLENLFQDSFSTRGGLIESGELALKQAESDRLLSTGIFARWSK